MRTHRLSAYIVLPVQCYSTSTATVRVEYKLVYPYGTINGGSIGYNRYSTGSMRIKYDTRTITVGTATVLY